MFSIAFLIYIKNKIDYIIETKEVLARKATLDLQKYIELSSPFFPPITRIFLWEKYNNLYTRSQTQMSMQNTPTKIIFYMKNKCTLSYLVLKFTFYMHEEHCSSLFCHFHYAYTIITFKYYIS